MLDCSNFSICITVYQSTYQYNIMHYSSFQYITICSCITQCITIYYSMDQHITIYCSIFQYNILLFYYLTQRNDNLFCGLLFFYTERNSLCPRSSMSECLTIESELRHARQDQCQLCRSVERLIEDSDMINFWPKVGRVFQKKCFQCIYGDEHTVQSHSTAGAPRQTKTTLGSYYLQ